jgi:hypothetical protein
MCMFMCMLSFLFVLSFEIFWKFAFPTSPPENRPISQPRYLFSEILQIIKEKCTDSSKKCTDVHFCEQKSRIKSKKIRAFVLFGLFLIKIIKSWHDFKMRKCLIVRLATGHCIKLIQIVGMVLDAFIHRCFRFSLWYTLCSLYWTYTILNRWY